MQQPGVANVTPLTNANLALALGGDPAALLARAGIANANFATSAFAADRAGKDKVLDSVKIGTGTDGATSKAFVQMEGIIGSGNVLTRPP
ncbi:MAG TPA: hypothetical protein DCW29_06095 [Janthinobacterium sp.]|nr:hypothetical protein [Janthinobacterium sp.]